MALIRIVLLVLASLAAANGREFQALIAAEEARIIAALPVVPPGLNAAHALEIKESKTVSAVHAYTVGVPDLRAVEWIIFTPRPPDFPGQKVLDAHTIPGSEPTFELSPLKQPIMRARIPVRNTKLSREVLLETRMDAKLYSRQLIQRIGKKPEDSAAPLAARDRQLFLRRTSQFDYTSRTFQKWANSNDLVRARTEGEVDFARRVFLRIAKDFEYEYLGEQDRKASHVCQVGKSDCGGLAVLFATVLRSQGIPARTLAGRWAVSAKPDEKIGEVKYHQEHIKAEFFAQGVGWVPVDLSSAILHDRSPGKLEYFGKDPGDFLTLHFDNDLALDTLYFGIRPMALLQRPSYWVRGSGTLDNAVIRESWNVTRRAP
jgi:transglutaminase-like putative cysteine protease